MTDGILEHALLPVTPGREDEFERALELALPIISAAPGFRHLSISRGIESPSSYLLLVGWDSVEAHEVGFRGSPEFQRWRELLHPFYESPAVVEHFTEVATARP